MKKLLFLLLIGILCSSTLQFLHLPLSQGDAAHSTHAFPELANQINACLSAVPDWKEVVDIGLVMHKASMSDFDSWIMMCASASDWRGVFAVKRYAVQAGYTSSTVDSKVKLALSNMPMFTKYSLPKTDGTYFSPWDRYVLYGYQYVRELNWETNRWNVSSAFQALKVIRDWYGGAFYEGDPDTPWALDLYGTRWHQAGSLMDCFFILYKLGVSQALDYAVQEWNFLNSNMWWRNGYKYASLEAATGWEFSGISVMPNVGKLNRYGVPLDNFDRMVMDLKYRYVNSFWDSPQWSQEFKQVVEHQDPGNPETRLDGTIDAWIMLDEYYPFLDDSARVNMRKMLEGDTVVQAWRGLMASDLKEPSTNRFRLARPLADTGNYDDAATARAALCMFIEGISPQSGRGLAIPFVSDRHSCYAALNYRHFEFDYVNHEIKIPVWGGSELKFLFGSPVTTHFTEDGVYRVTFSPEWDSVVQVTKVSDLYAGEYYADTPTSLAQPPWNGTVNIPFLGEVPIVYVISFVAAVVFVCLAVFVVKRRIVQASSAVRTAIRER